MKKWFLSYGFIIFTTCLIGQNPVFRASTNAKQVVEGGTFTVTYALENAEGANFIPPNFTPFKKISGPMQSMSTTIINGKRSSSVSYSYTLQAGKKGTYSLKPASIRVKNKEINSNVVIIEVVEGKDPLALGDETNAENIFFVRAEIDTNQVYIGQQVILRYKIYTQINIENYNFISESEYNGCYAQKLEAYKEPVVKEVIGGKQYSTKVLRKMALFPQQSGKIEIEPIVVRVGIPSNNPRFRGFFSSFNLESKTVSSNSVEFYVRSPYPHAPENFSGAVGQFQATFKLSPRKVSTDDAMTLQIKVTGNGDTKTIRPPDLDLPQSFEIYDPSIRNEKMVNITDYIRGEKTFEYLMIGNTAGTYKISPSFTFFDPGLDTFISLSDTFSVVISQGEQVLHQPSDNQLYHAGAEDILPIMVETRLKRKRYFQPWSNFLYGAAFVLPLLLFGGALRRHQLQQNQGDVPIDHTAIAKERLAKAYQHLLENDPKLFYEEIAYSIKNYLSHKLAINPAELTKNYIVESLLAKKMDASDVEKIRQLLHACDLALYSGKTKATDMQETYKVSVDTIAGLESVIS